MNGDQTRIHEYECCFVKECVRYTYACVQYGF